ncbi:MAG: MFS transporter [Solirubrobacterales bacterium]|nr:MFS transporter [Solirubrobacterales bacterium]
MSAKSRGMAAACAIGMAVSWNIADVGAVAEPIADHYGVALATVGLFTTVLFFAELASMAALGRLVERHGAKLLGLGALGLCAIGNLLTLAVDGIVAALVLRFVVGIGVGLGFVGGTTYVQHVGGGPLAQGPLRGALAGDRRPRRGVDPDPRGPARLAGTLPRRTRVRGPRRPDRRRRPGCARGPRRG